REHRCGPDRPTGNPRHDGSSQDARYWSVPPRPSYGARDAEYRVLDPNVTVRKVRHVSMLLCSMNMFPQQIGNQRAQLRWIQRLMQDGQPARLGIPQPIGRCVAGDEQRWDIDVELA